MSTIKPEHISDNILAPEDFLNAASLDTSQTGRSPFSGQTKKISQRTDQMYELPFTKKVIYFTPESQPTSNVHTNSVHIDIYLKSKTAESISDLRIVSNYSETGGVNNITLSPHSLTIDYIEILPQGGTISPIQTLYGDCLFIDHNRLTTESVSHLAAIGNFTNTYGGGSAIGAGSSAIYITELLNLCFNTHKINLQAIEEPIIIRVHFRIGVISAGTGTLSFDRFRLLGTEYELPEFLRDKYKDYKLKHINKGRYLDTIKVSSSSANAYAGGVLSDMDISTIRGKVAYMYILFRTSKSATGDSIITYTDLGNETQFDIVNGVGNRLLANGSTILGCDIRYNHMPKQFAGTLAYNKPVYCLTFGDVNDANQGIINGYFNFNINEKYILNVIPDSSFAGANLYVDIYAYVFKNIYESEGRIVSELA